MDDETPQMEVVSAQMRAAMAQWVQDPGNEALKRRFLAQQKRYQRLFSEYKQSQMRANGAA